MRSSLCLGLVIICHIPIRGNELLKSFTHPLLFFIFCIMAKFLALFLHYYIHFYHSLSWTSNSFCRVLLKFGASLAAQMVKKKKKICLQCRRPRFDPGERFPGVGNSNPLQYSCLEKLMDRETWWATVHWVAKSQTGQSN